MALSNSDKVKVIKNHVDVQALDFEELLKAGMVSHASTILYNENDVTYEEIENQAPHGVGRKALVDLAKRVVENSETFIDAFRIRYANDSSLTDLTDPSTGLIAKIPDIIPAIFPEIAGLIRYDRP